MRIRNACGRRLFERMALAAAILLAGAQPSLAGIVSEDLLPPCSAGIAPCRVEEPAPHAVPNPRGAAPVATTSMLPCPLSVPCIATGDNDYYDREGFAPAPSASGSKSSPASATLVTRVMPDDSADGDSAGSAQGGPDQEAAGRPIAPSSGAKAPAAPASRSVAPSSAASASVSLEGTGDLKTRAEQSVRDLGTKLARVDASAFNADDAQTYLQALDLERAARRALSDRDYLAALDLSRKATDLAGTLSTNRQLLR